MPLVVQPSPGIVNTYLPAILVDHPERHPQRDAFPPRVANVSVS